ncbi:MAG: PAS domain S-box protein [Chloroflexi bacterium]|nr:PAS domain S-box protein [Chloroflexota bacterium]
MKPIRAIGAPLLVGAAVLAAVAADLLLMITRDLVARKKAEPMFRILLDTAPDAIVIVNSSGRILLVNAQAENLFGYHRHELLGQPVEILIPEHLRSLHAGQRTRYHAAPRTRPMGIGLQLSARRKDGSEFPAEISLSPLQTEDGTLVTSVIRDVTERKRAEEERAQLIREQAARTEAEAAAETIRRLQAISDAALAHLSLDDLLRELPGRIRETLAGDAASILLVDGDTLVAWATRGMGEGVEPAIRVLIDGEPAARIIAERRSLIVEPVERTDLFGSPGFGSPGNESGIESLLGTPLLLEDQLIGLLAVGTHRPHRFTEDDARLLQLVADRVALAIDHARLYEAEQRARAEAEAAVHVRDEFLSIAAHELRTPVTSLRGFAQLMVRLIDKEGAVDPVRLRRAFQVIDQQSVKLSRLVSQLLDVSRLEAGKLILDRAATDVSSLVESVAAGARVTTSQHVIVVSAPSNVRALVDPLRLEQVVANLVDNAIKYSPTGGQIDVEVSQPTHDTVCLSVTDRGIGIPPESRERIFDRFYQAHAGSGTEGMGLGLYISHQIVQLHGGQIAAQFPSDGGTRFVVTLPTNLGDDTAPIAGGHPPH